MFERRCVRRKMSVGVTRRRPATLARLHIRVSTLSWCSYLATTPLWKGALIKCTQVHQNDAQIWRRGLCRVSSLPLANTKTLSRTYISRLPSSATALQPSQHLLNTTHVRCIHKPWLFPSSCYLMTGLFFRSRALYVRADTLGVYMTVERFDFPFSRPL